MSSTNTLSITERANSAKKYIESKIAKSVPTPRTSSESARNFCNKSTDSSNYRQLKTTRVGVVRQVNKLTTSLREQPQTFFNLTLILTKTLFNFKLRL